LLIAQERKGQATDTEIKEDTDIEKGFSRFYFRPPVPLELDAAVTEISQQRSRKKNG